MKFIKITQLDGNTATLNVAYIRILQSVPLEARAELLKQGNFILGGEMAPTGISLDDGRTLIVKESIDKVNAMIMGE